MQLDNHQQLDDTFFVFCIYQDNMHLKKGYKETTMSDIS